MPVVVILNGEQSTAANIPPSTAGGGMPNRMLPLMGVGVLAGLFAKGFMPMPSKSEVSLG